MNSDCSTSACPYRHGLVRGRLLFGLLSVPLIGVLLMTGCGNQQLAEPTEPSALTSDSQAQVEPETPSDPQLATQTIEAMLALAQAGDWGAYVDGYYGESYKFQSAADRDALVQRFQERWGDQVITALEQAAQIEPNIDGDQALFLVDGNPVFVLYRTTDGGWAFHL
jgi:hypothetical protein